MKGKDFSLSFITEALSWSVIEKADVTIQLFLRHLLKALSFRKELAKQLVRILIGTTFPRVVRMGEIDLHANLLSY